MATCLPSRAGTVPVRLAVDSTGLKQHNRGEWIRHKWKVRRGFVKLHVMVDVDTKKILAVQVPTTEPETRRCSFRYEALEAVTDKPGAGFRRRTGRRRMLPVRGCRLRFQKQRDCMRGSWRGFTHQAQGKLDGRGKGTGDAWGIAVRKQLGGSADSHVWKMSDDEKRRFGEEWKKKVNGKRWLVEIVFSHSSGCSASTCTR